METQSREPRYEREILETIRAWQSAATSGNVEDLRRMLDDNVVFLAPGQPPMQGKDSFSASYHAAFERFQIESICDVRNIQIAGGWACCWCHLTVTMTPRTQGMPMHRSGYTLTVMCRKPDGRWVIARDANMLTPDNPGAPETKAPARRSMGGIIQPG